MKRVGGQKNKMGKAEHIGEVRFKRRCVVPGCHNLILVYFGVFDGQDVCDSCHKKGYKNVRFGGRK